MLNGANLNLVTFDIWRSDVMHSGQVMALFVIVIAAAEVGVGLAIVLLVFRNRSTIAVDSLRELRERTDRDGTAREDAVDPP
jgi:NADH-quinone oxidoreductase subunit K